MTLPLVPLRLQRAGEEVSVWWSEVRDICTRLNRLIQQANQQQADIDNLIVDLSRRFVEAEPSIQRIQNAAATRILSLEKKHFVRLMSDAFFLTGELNDAKVNWKNVLHRFGDWVKALPDGESVPENVRRNFSSDTQYINERVSTIVSLLHELRGRCDDTTSRIESIITVPDFDYPFLVVTQQCEAAGLSF